MRVDLTTMIHALNGEAFNTGEVRLVEKTNDEGEVQLDDQGNPVMVNRPVELTVRDLLLSAYAQPVPKLSLTEKVARGVMAQRIYEAERYLDMTANDVVKAKDLLNETVGHPVIMMRMVALLDPPSIREVTDGSDTEA